MKIICVEYFGYVDTLVFYVTRNKIKKNDIQQILQVGGRYMLVFWRNSKKKLIEIKEILEK